MASDLRGQLSLTNKISFHHDVPSVNPMYKNKQVEQGGKKKILYALRWVIFKIIKKMNIGENAVKCESIKVQLLRNNIMIPYNLKTELPCDLDNIYKLTNNKVHWFVPSVVIMFIFYQFFFLPIVCVCKFVNGYASSCV